VLDRGENQENRGVDYMGPRVSLACRGPGRHTVVVIVHLVCFGLLGVLAQAQCVDKDATDGEWLPGTSSASSGRPSVIPSGICAMIASGPDPSGDCAWFLGEGLPEDHCCICWPGPSVPTLNDLQTAIPAMCKVPLTLGNATDPVLRMISSNAVELI
jgi:hypothetical protein